MNIRFVTVVAAAAGLASSVFAQFNNGNLVVLQADQNGSGTLSAVAAAVQLRGYQPGFGFTGFNVSINNGNFGTRQTISGSSTSEGFLGLSANGQYLLTGGYDAARGAGGSPFPTGSGSVATSTVTEANRIMGITSLSGTTTLYRMTDAFSQANMRTPASIDGSTFYGISSRDGVRYLDPSLGTTTTPASSASLLANIRTAAFTPFALAGGIGQASLVVSANSTTGPLVGLGVVNTTTGTITALPGLGAITGSPYQFVFADSDTIYIADDGSLGTTGGLRRYDYDVSSGNWLQTYRLTAGLTLGIRALTIDPTTGTLYAIQAGASAGAVTSLVSVVDGGPTSSFSVLATSAPGTVFRGVQFVPTPGSAALLGIGMLAAGRRRRV